MDCSLSGPLSMGFSRQESWSGQPCPSPEMITTTNECSQCRPPSGMTDPPLWATFTTRGPQPGGETGWRSRPKRPCRREPPCRSLMASIKARAQCPRCAEEASSGARRGPTTCSGSAAPHQVLSRDPETRRGPSGARGRQAGAEGSASGGSHQRC